MDLFDIASAEKRQKTAPLAARMRPRTLDEYIGQEEIIGKGRLLRRAIEADQLSSVIFYGPPGSGKTTLAEIIANTTGGNFRTLSAVSSGVADIRELLKFAREEQKLYGRRTVLFIDEIHRFNKAQQDALLPAVEDGTVVLIGATTENPFFEVNSALISRSRIFRLKALTPEHIYTLLQRALEDPRGLADYHASIDEAALRHWANVCGGDARTAYNAMELAVVTTEPGEDGLRHVDLSIAEESIQARNISYDKDGDWHYDVISAFIKSMRGSDPDATLHWLARMTEAGENPEFIARRIMICAAEDVGLADPRAMEVAVAAYQACHFIGVPECSVHLAEAVVYMSLASKSNAMEMAVNEAKEAIEKEPDAPVPLVIRNAPTRLMKNLNYGKGYQYAHDYAEKMTAMQCLPDALKDRQFYHPTTQGQEARYKERLEQITAWKKEHRK